MLLDRLVDSAGLEVVPGAVCDVRKGVGVELPTLAEPQLHCVVRGSGTLRGASGLTLPLEAGSIAIVPAHTSHRLEPLGGVARTLKVGAAVSSDHVPALTAGGGEAGLVFVCGRIRASRCDALGLFERLLVPVAVSLADVGHVPSMLEMLLDEQAGRAPGNRRMAALLMQQCLMHVLRRLCQEPAAPLPWLGAIRDRSGLGRALDSMLRAPGGPHSVKSLAASAGMGRATFSQKFVQAFGQTPIDWLNHIRMHEAMRLLRTTELSLDSVAARVGLTGGSPVFRQLRAATHGTAGTAGTAGSPDATRAPGAPGGMPVPSAGRSKRIASAPSAR